MLLYVAAYQRRMGHIDAAQVTVDRAIQRYEARLPETKSEATWRWGYAWALYAAGRCDEAYSVVQPLSEQFPAALNYRGFVGALAACQGHRARLGIAEVSATR